MFVQLINHTNTNPSQTFQVVKDKINALESAYYTYDLDVPLNFAETDKAEKFWKALKIKAKNADRFATNIKTCEWLKDAPLGFIRKITQANPDGKVDEIRERVWISETEKSILFVQTETTGKLRLVAINELQKKKEGYAFVGRYVFEVLKNSSSSEDRQTIEALQENFPKFAKITMDNLIKFYKEGKVEETYKAYYPTT